MSEWIAGKDLTINDVCTEELARMNELDKEIYGELPLRTEAASQ